MKRKSLLSQIKKRKKDHLRIAFSLKEEIGKSGFSLYHFEHNAIPEINFDKITTATTFLGKEINYPFFISCMVGGIQEGERINNNLAKAAQKFKIPMGVGSQRIAIEYPELERFFNIRKYAPDIPILANIGLVQLNYGYGLSELNRIIEMVDADALVVHLNPLHEILQQEGNKNFENLIPKLEKVVKSLKKPVIIKEVGFGLSADVVKRLYAIGVKIFDTAGWGGTNWLQIEGKRFPGQEDLSQLFSSWGILTTESIRQISAFKKQNKISDMSILGSGGVRNGLDIAKGLSLGADLMGIGAPFIKAAFESQEMVESLIEKYSLELRISMFGIGAVNIPQLKRSKLISVI